MRRCGRMLLVIWLCVLSGAAWAERRVALVLSTGRYEFIRPLDNPRNDGVLIEDALDRLGFEVTTESDRDLRRMRRALEDFVEDAAGADVALVYFAGHGVEIGGENRLLPVDAEPSSLERLKETSLSLEEVRTAAAKVAKSVLIVLDACRNDPFGAAAGSAKGRGAVALGADVVQAAKPGLGRIGRAENTLFAFSAAPGETASDGTGEHSPFAAALARYLPTDGLEIRSVLTLVQQDVYDETAGAQLPYVESGLPQVFFAAQSGALPEREALLLAMADVTPDLRDEVERVAAVNAMPLAPLYGALISADLKSLSVFDRDQKLAEAAQAFVRTRNELKTLASSDPQVTRLRDEAQRSLSLGAFDKARGSLAEAARIDAESSDALAGKLVARRISEADSHQATAGVALAQLDYTGAIAALELAAALHQRIEGEELSVADRGKRNRILQQIGDIHLRIGANGLALESYRRLEAASRLLLARNPQNDDAIRDTAIAADLIGDALRARGDRAGALKSYEEALDLRAGQRSRMDGNADWLYGVTNVVERIGDMQRELGNLDAALEKYDASLMFRRWLAEHHGGVERYREGVLFALARVGVARFAKSDLAGAEAVWSERLALARTLAAETPGSDARQTRLAEALYAIGDLYLARKRDIDALAAYEESAAVSIRLTDKEPGNTVNQRYLAGTLVKLAERRAAAGNTTGAGEALRRNLAIRELLSAADPGNLEWRRDLMRAYIHVALTGDRSAENIERALTIGQDLEQAGKVTPEEKHLLDAARQELHRLKQ